MQEIKKEIIDGKEVITISRSQEMSEGLLNAEISRLGMEQERLILEAERLRQRYETAKEHEKFYKEELEKIRKKRLGTTDVFELGE